MLPSFPIVSAYAYLGRVQVTRLHYGGDGVARGVFYSFKISPGRPAKLTELNGDLPRYMDTKIQPSGLAWLIVVAVANIDSGNQRVPCVDNDYFLVHAPP